ncbi:MAG: phospholipase [Actinobacteria bacterium]|nr:phospholipase [Actinomycetota bacterium]
MAAAALLAGPARAQQAPNPGYAALTKDVLVNADYWDAKPKMLAAGLGFTNILGVPNADSADPLIAQAAVQAVSGAWNVGLTCASTPTPSQRAYTSAASPRQIFFSYGVAVTNGSGMPVEFSWPVLPSTVDPTDFRVTLSDGSIVTPQATSIMPNMEYNERSTVVLIGAFGTPFPSSEGGLSVTKVEVVRDATPMKLIGPRARKVSAVGMSATKTTSPYDVPSSDPTTWTGPRLTGGKISRMSTAGEKIPALFGGDLRNDGVDLYGKAAKFRLRVLTTGGFSPDGIRSLYPTDYRKFFQVVARSRSGKLVRLITPGKTYRIDGHPLRVLGLADVGIKQASYDACYREDHDNQIDIVLSGSIKAAERVRTVVIPATGNGYQPLYNPGGPGTTPVTGVHYTSPGPRSSQKIVNALRDPMTVTYAAR